MMELQIKSEKHKMSCYALSLFKTVTLNHFMKQK